MNFDISYAALVAAADDIGLARMGDYPHQGHDRFLIMDPNHDATPNDLVYFTLALVDQLAMRYSPTEVHELMYGVADVEEVTVDDRRAYVFPRINIT